MQHTYLTQANILASLKSGAITYKEADELTSKLETCVKRVMDKAVIRLAV